MPLDIQEMGPAVLLLWVCRCDGVDKKAKQFDRNGSEQLNPGRFTYLVNYENVTNGKDVTSVVSLFV